MSETSDKSEENVDIIVNYPFLKHEELFSIPTDSNYENIIYTLYEEVATEEDHGRSEGDFSRIVSISVLDPRGYIYMPIQLEYGVDMNTLLIRDNAGIIPLKNEDLVTCSRFSDKFSPRRPINLLLQQIIQDYAFVGVCVSGGVIDYDVRYMELFQDFYAHHGSAFKDQYILATAPFHYFGYRNMSAASNRLSNYSERMKQCTKLPTHLNVNDGNAYYRSVYFGLFEQIIVGKNLHLFGLIADMFRKNGHSVHVHPSSNSDSSDHKPDALIEEDADFQELINTLELASSKQSFESGVNIVYEYVCLCVHMLLMFIL